MSTVKIALLKYASLRFLSEYHCPSWDYWCTIYESWDYWCTIYEPFTSRLCSPAQGGETWIVNGG